MTTDMSTSYPNRYYGIRSTSISAIDIAIDAWKLTTNKGTVLQSTNIPKEENLIPMTEDQWILSGYKSLSDLYIVPLINGVIQYPKRYYCGNQKPCPVYDMWGYSTIDNRVDINQLYPITAAEFQDRLANPRSQYFDTDTNTLKDYVPPAAVPTLDSRMAELEALCQQHMTSGLYFIPSAYTTAFLFDTGAASQSKMLTSFVSASNGLWPTTAVWKIDDGSFVNMTATDVINLAKKSQAYIQACYATEADLQTKLQADLTTDITVGWPSNK